MEKFNQNKASEMLTQLMDNELSGADKQKILNQIKDNDGLQSEQNAHQKIREAIKGDEEKHRPPLAATAAVFGAVGISYPVEATGTGVLIGAFLKKNWMPISVAFLALIGSFLYMFDSGDSKPAIAENGKSKNQEVVKSSSDLANASDNFLVNNSKNNTQNSDNPTNNNLTSQNLGSSSESISTKSLKSNSSNSSVQSSTNENLGIGSKSSKSNTGFASSESKSNDALSILDNSNSDVLDESANNYNESNLLEDLASNSNHISDLYTILSSDIEPTISRNNFGNLGFYSEPYKKRSYFTDIHKESIFNLGFSGFSNQENQNAGLGGQISLNVSRISPKLSGVVSQLRFNVLSESITKLDGTNGFGNSRVALSAKINPEIQYLNKLNTDFGRPIVEIGIGNFEGITPVFSAGYEIRLISKTVLELKYTQFGIGIIGIGLSKGF